MMPNLVAAGLTDVGKKRTQNQDSYFSDPISGLFIVADGMGGHKGGEVASQLSVATIAEFFQDSKNQTLEPKIRLKKALQAANQAIRNKSQLDISLHGMGTTTVAMVFHGTTLYIGHVGDSRAYLVHPSRIWQLTRDHSLVQEKLRAGIISRAQLKTDKMKHVLTRSVGVETDLEVDIYDFESHSGDIFLLCSDGLYGMMEDTTIQKIVESNRGELKQVVKELIETANNHGGDDNVTAVVVQIK